MPGKWEGVALAVALAALSIFFAWRQWLELSDRETQSDPANERYFLWKARRRFLGSALMLALAAGIGFGSQIDGRASRATARLFGWTWEIVALLVFILVILAVLDSIATFRYAIRMRRDLIRQRNEFLVSESIKHRHPRNGRPPPPESKKGDGTNY